MGTGGKGAMEIFCNGKAPGVGCQEKPSTAPAGDGGRHAPPAGKNSEIAVDEGDELGF
jgi:hypothetical protein